MATPSAQVVALAAFAAALKVLVASQVAQKAAFLVVAYLAVLVTFQVAFVVRMG